MQQCGPTLSKSKITEAPRVEPELAGRLERIYGLERRPKGPREFFQLLRVFSKKSPRTKAFLALVRSGKAVIGASERATKDWIIGANGEKVFTYCSYDILMTAILRRESVIGSSCPHCGKAMSIRIKGGKLENFSPKEMMFLWGTGPEGSPGNPMCDHLHLFPSREHMSAWLKSREGEMGFSFKVPDAVNYFVSRF